MADNTDDHNNNNNNNNNNIIDDSYSDSDNCSQLSISSTNTRYSGFNSDVDKDRCICKELIPGQL